MNRSVVAACALVLAAALSGCDDTATTPSDPRQSAIALPDDLCSLIPASYTSAWGLSDSGHTTDNGTTTSTATCEMTGERVGAPVAFTATATTFADAEDADAQQRTTTALESACDDLIENAAGETQRDDFRCSDVTSGDDAATRGQVRDISQLAGGKGLLVVEMVHHGEAWLSVAPDVTGIAGSILSAVGTD